MTSSSRVGPAIATMSSGEALREGRPGRDVRQFKPERAGVRPARSKRRTSARPARSKRRTSARPARSNGEHRPGSRRRNGGHRPGSRRRYGGWAPAGGSAGVADMADIGTGPASSMLRTGRPGVDRRRRYGGHRHRPASPIRRTARAGVARVADTADGTGRGRPRRRYGGHRPRPASPIRRTSAPPASSVRRTGIGRHWPRVVDTADIREQLGQARSVVDTADIREQPGQARSVVDATRVLDKRVRRGLAAGQAIAGLHCVGLALREAAVMRGR
jgi:hypothetical protein